MVRIVFLTLALLSGSSSFAFAGWWTPTPPDPMRETAQKLMRAADAGEFDQAANIIREVGFCHIGKLEKAFLRPYDERTAVSDDHIAVEYLTDGSIKATFWRSLEEQWASLPVVTVPLAKVDCSETSK